MAALTPTVKQVSHQKTGLLEAAIEQNVRNNVAALTAQSDILRKAHEAGSLRIVGGIYRLATGKVDFLAQDRANSFHHASPRAPATFTRDRRRRSRFS
ncbi:carbonic anhydrase [Castellaniella sp. UC4442_H9]